jgi:hypothetical protein
MELARSLAPPGDPVAAALVELLERRGAAQTSPARAQFEAFAFEEWSLLRQALQPRVLVLPPDSPFFEYLAVRLLGEATAVQRRAVSSKDPAVWHELRKAIKRLRYVVENFLPARAELWINHLKLLQDLLGEAHDLDVLWTTLPEVGPVLDPKAAQRWRGLLGRQRSLRIRSYTRKMSGPRSLWRAWRRALPSRAAWFSFAGPAIPCAETAATTALELFDCLVSSGRAADRLKGRARDLLECAALCRMAGAPGARGGRKGMGQTLLERLPTLMDWPPSEVSMVALLVRHHSGRVPSLDDPAVVALPPSTRETFLVLLGVLRLAVILDSVQPDGLATI